MVAPPAGLPAMGVQASPAPIPMINGMPMKGKSAAQSAPGTLNGPPSGNNHAIPLSARRAEPLDMSKVERRGQPSMPQYASRKTRPNGIPDAPIFRPTEEEFRDPMEYMRKIAPEGRKYGIVKIIPPESWNPAFAINTERFHFRTRRQELNSVEGGNRVNNDYLDQLAKFHKTHGHSLNRFQASTSDHSTCTDSKTVERKGGFDAVCKGKRWAEVGRDLGYSGKIMSSLSTSLKNSYQKWLLPYEDYLRLAKPGVQQHMMDLNGGPFTPSPGPSPAKKSQTSTPMGVKEETPAMRASSVLNANLNGHTPVSNDNPTPAPATTGFTPVNAGFTAVNASNSFTSTNGSMPPSDNVTPSQTPQPNGHISIAPNPTGVVALKRQHSDSILSNDEIDALGRRSKRLRRDTPTIPGSNMHHSRMGASRMSARDRATYKPGEVCEGCGRPGDSAKLITCESCDCTWHMYCLDVPLKHRPEFEWHCPRCLVGTNEYGFEEGDVYSLSAFQRRAEEFKTAHFAGLPRQHNPLSEHKREPTEEDVEREFWRLVDDIHDSVEVEYGADIHSTTHGSGFPTIEKQPRDPYSADPWNLNILPLDKESLFRHIKSDISGMTVPWLYVGMVFSTFCWHNEDHFSYSANYQHFGSTKTWYGIPGEDSYNFEQAMREEVPELFEMQPDILFQLVTLAKPEKLAKAGVRVFAVDQHAGEFVITYPRAYHAGFNHGFNFNEAVNFAPSDWEPFGEEGVRRLRDYRKQPCFSHDELLLTAAAGSYNIRTAKWLAPALERLRDSELSARRFFVHGEQIPGAVASESTYNGPRYQGEPHIIRAEDEADDEEFTCMHCKAYCYLSRLLCIKTGKSVCLLHAGAFECCDAPESERYAGSNSEHILCYRTHDNALDGIVRKAADKASIPETWSQKVEAELLDNPTPSLRHLRTLLAEGEKIQYDLPQLPDLERFVKRCNEWVDDATNYITRKQQNRRKNEKVWRKSTSKTAELEERDKELRNVDNIRKLLKQADDICFECPEITTLRERADSIDSFRRDADEALHNVQSKSVQDFEELVDRGKEFHVDIPEIDQLETLLKRLRWNEMAVLKRPTMENPRQDLTLSDVEKFINEGIEIGVPEQNEDIMYFREQKAHGEMWEQKAQELMSVEHVHFQQLDALSRQATTLPVSAETLARIDAILKKQREVQEIIALYEQTKDLDFRKRPMYREVRDVIASLDELQSKPAGTIDLEKEQKRHEDWMRRGKKLFGKANAPLHILHQHMQIVEARNESCFDLRDKPRMPVEPSSRANTPDEHSDRPNDGSGSSRDVFCICRRPEAGMMIECELCHEWYHGKCLKIARGKVKEDDKYTCPICDWRVKIPRDAARPKLEDLQGWQDELETLPFQPEEEDTLNNIVSHGQAFRDFLRPYVNPISPASPDEVGTLRFHLRKIEGADILLSYETNYLRQELHKWAPVAPIPPPVIDISMSTRKPRPTKQQKIMAQLGITNPDDLPPQFKIKPHIAKRKASEAMGKTSSSACWCRRWISSTVWNTATFHADWCS
ncbi:hypothetical protein AMS68_007742 [Peltaster fructicola]|uniref:[Histone H3]-trimethyl-L-lysine(4) demethylase n=1 Tax=Peltaster fructicola TaxID=286661 RepID=A0A6H0Y5Q2_9PEZI|nr:hypothetical protein AMS68_007742 [Peltaster fructicola]